MNSLIQSWNLQGDRFLSFAWPLLWQSSALMAILFLSDLALRKKIRAAVRYTLWLVVLVKLLLPPSLALPTGPAWWLRSAPAVSERQKTSTVIVTYQSDTPAIESAATPTLAPPPRFSVSVAAWILIGCGAVSAGLFAWMIRRWIEVARDVRRAAAPPDDLGRLLEESRLALGLKQNVDLRLTDLPISPAVCGFFRPVLLLPRPLAEQLRPAQLRAVLLHELIHLQRRDVWVNCAQTLLQIVFWWHPLLWLANARIRRLREEAVDDAVMLSLREDADHYAPTLLEVARLAFNRPLASLGLVGILEAKHALRHRIERLLNFKTPGRAGLSLASLIGIAAFTVVAVPMGEAPEQTSKSATTLVSHDHPWPDPHFNEYKNIDLKPAFFLMEESKLSQLFPGFNSAKPATWIRKQDATQFRRELASVGVKLFTNTPALQMFSGGRFHWALAGQTNPVGNRVNYQLQRVGNRDVVTGAEVALNLPEWTAQEFTLIPWAERDALRCELAVTDEGKDKTSHQEMFLRAGEMGFWAVPDRNRAGWYQIVLFFASQGENSHHTPSADATLEATADIAGFDTETRIANYSNHVVIRYETNLLTADSASINQLTGEIVAEGHPRFNNGDSTLTSDRMRYNYKTGMVESEDASQRNFTRRNTPEIPRTVALLNQPAPASQAKLPTTPEVNIKVKFVTVPENFLATLPNSLGATNGALAPGTIRGFNAILTPEQARTVLQALNKSSSTNDLFAEGQVTTLSGRQAQIQMVELKTVVMNINPQALKPPGISAPSGTNLYQLENMQLGPILDVIPTVSADGNTIELRLTAKMTEFLGYDETEKGRSTKAYVDGKEIELSVPRPNLRTHQMTADMTIRDGLTVMMLSGYPTETKNAATGKSGPEKKFLLFLVSTALIDSGGNLIHSDQGLPAAQKGVSP